MADVEKENKNAGPAGPDFPVIGIGASAGGVQALLRLFESAPPDAGAAFVVVLHLSPDYASHAHDVIQHVTGLRVRQVTASVPLEINNVYVIPPGKQLSMFDGYLRLTDPTPPRVPPTSIDVFFRSLADAHGSRAVSIVLSGSGSDGSVGIARVRERGGLTLAQKPEEAEYSAMPRAAISTGDVDYVLPVAEILPKVLALVRSAAKITLPSPSDERPTNVESNGTDDGAIEEILDLLRERSHHDFSNYKRGTIVRRIERRMQVNAVTTAVGYRDFLKNTVEETPKLLADMLIGVTNFFRDPEAFVALEQALTHALPANLQGREELRAWVPACSTGEEAFSVAIALCEIARRLPQRPHVTVYATDIDDRAIALARAANYPDAISNDISSSRLAEYFVKDGNRYRLTKALRDTVVFAAHNILRDPPFSRIDVVSCRNLLIYFNRQAQIEVLRTLHFSLRTGGILFLGSAESADFVTELYEPLDKQRRLYRAIPGAGTEPLSLTAHRAQSTFSGQSFFAALGSKPSKRNIELLNSPDVFGPAALMIRTTGDILHRSGNVTSLAHDIRGRRVANLFEIVRAEAHDAVRCAIEQCLENGLRETVSRVPFETSTGELLVDLLVRPSEDPSNREPLVSVICDILSSTADSAVTAGIENDGETIGSLKQALAGSEDRLRSSLEYAQTSAEELRASNEELQAMNEELRSTTEELEAGREELQSLNEELITVNSELMIKAQESARVSDDLRNLISLVGVATIFVDRVFTIKRYTSPAETLFNILPSDQGRPLQHLTHRLKYPEMLDDLRSAFDDLKKIEREVSGMDGRHFLARVLPYRTDDDRIDGAVLALIDITEQRSAQEQVRRSEEKLKLAARATHDFAIIVLDDDGTIVSWNVGAHRIFGYTDKEMTGTTLDAIFTREDRADRRPAREREIALEQGRAEDERWHLAKDGTRLYCSGFLSRIDVPGFRGFAKIVHNTTERKLSEAKREETLAKEIASRSESEKLSRLKDEFIAVLSHELKNPLNLIHMKAEMLARLPEARHLRRTQEVADAIQKSVVSQAQIIDDLLDFSRVQTGKLSLRFAPTDVTAIVRSIAETVSNDFKSASVQLQLDLPIAPVLVRGDAVRIEQIVWNLTTNALKFTPKGGKVSISLGLEHGQARLDVTDDGIGIAPEGLKSIFEMFHQVPDASHRSRAGGLGIGLSLVKQLAQLHGGRAEAFSDGIGHGSRFVVYLPADASFVQRKAGDTPTDLSIFNNLRILLVEDQQDSLTAMSELFALYEARVTAATRGEEALSAAEVEVFDVVLTDVNLPDVDGYELVSRLRKTPTCASIPIIAVTGRPVAHEEGRARAAGCDACLSKPFNLQAVADVIQRQQSGSAR